MPSEERPEILTLWGNNFNWPPCSLWHLLNFSRDALIADGAGVRNAA
jgi:hypothetical protein